MKLEQAIEELTDCMSESEKLLYPEVWAAHKLGIEALKRIEWYRSKYRGSMNDPLPGETEE